MPSRFCTECGTALQTGQRFCPECGTAVQTTASAAQPAASQQPISKPASQPAASRPNRPPMALLLGLGALAIAIVLVTAYWATAQPPAIVGNFPVETSPDGIPFPDVQRISVVEAGVAAGDGNAIIVDVRSRGQYAASHIIGAVLIPIDEFETRYSELPQNTQIITYCT